MTAGIGPISTGTAVASGARWEERTVRLFEGERGLGAGIVGVLALAFVTVLDRFLSVPNLYARPLDALVHASAEFLAGSVTWLVCWSLLALGIRATRALSPPGGPRTASRVALAVLFGIALGAAGCNVVPRYSAYWRVAPPLAWWLGSMVAGVAVSALVFRALRSPIPARARPIGALILLIALGLHWSSLRNDWQRYGNLLALVQGVTPVLVAVGATLVSTPRAVHAASGRAAMALCVASVFLLAIAKPGDSTRRAVLVSGATAKHWILRAAWPALDRDGDGAPRMFWGTDPDDHDPKVTAFLGPVLATPEAVERVEVATGTAAPTNVLFVVIDTVRTDSFAGALARNAGLRAAYAPFATFKNYSSCSSRTYLVLAQLLDGFRCDPRRASGTDARSLVGILRSRGYRDELLTYYPPTVGFQKTTRIVDDRELVEAATRTIRAASTGPRAVFVHLKGGHAEYDAPGSTPRERYENQLARSLGQVAELAGVAASDRWSMVVVGDHGEAFGEHESVAHATTLYEEVLRTPLLIRSPHFRGGESLEPLGCSDVTWQVLRGAGLTAGSVRPLPYQYALLDLARARGVRAQRDSIRSLRRGDFKLLWRPQLGIWEFYDLAQDGRELRSIAESHRAEFEALRAELVRLTETCTVPASSASSESAVAPQTAL